MKSIKILIEEDPALENIEVRIRAPQRDAQIEALIGRISDQPSEGIIAADRNGVMQKIDVCDIVSVSVNGKQTQIVTENDVFNLRQPLQNIEKTLENHRFIRISRYEIVNLDKIKNFDFTLSGTLRIELVGGMETWASRRNIPQIRKKLSGKE